MAIMAILAANRSARVESQLAGTAAKRAKTPIERPLASRRTTTPIEV